MKFSRRRTPTVLHAAATSMVVLCAAAATATGHGTPRSKVETLKPTSTRIFSDPRLNNAYEPLSINGGFEGGRSPGRLRKLSDDAKDIEGWSVSGGVHYAGSAWPAYSGSRSVGLGAGATLARTFGTVPGNRYRVSFRARAKRPGTVRVAAADSARTHEVGSGRWTAFTFDFTATESSTRLSIHVPDSRVAHVLLDDVAVRSTGTEQPERWSKDGAAVLMMDHTTGGPEYWGLKTMGAPVVLATTLREALEYRMVVLSGTLAAGALSAEDVDLLDLHLRSGGVVVGEAITDRRLTRLFGIGDLAESATRTSVRIVADGGTVADLDHAAERHLPLGDRARGALPGTVGYSALDGTRVLAEFDDGSGALLATPYANGGAAYASGARMLDLVTRQHQGARFPGNDPYVNSVSARADAWLLWLRGVYREHVGAGVTLSTAPDAKQSAVIPTLSLNFSEGIPVVDDYVARARRAGAAGTVFVATRLRDDWLDSGFYRLPETRRQLLRVRKLGAEIASHSVVHSPVFHRLPAGSGLERIDGYVPLVRSRTSTTGATLLGELRVSRMLLALVGSKSRSFRAGYLLSRPDLGGALDGTGYAYDSSVTQGAVGGAFPFRVPRFDGRGYSEVTTFPIAVEDEKPPRIDRRVDDALRLISVNGANGAPSVLLFHPNPSPAKQIAWSKLLGGLPSNVWRGSLEEYGDFWDQRMRSELSTAASPVCAGGRRIRVTAVNRGVHLRGQSLDVPGGSLRVLKVVDGPTLRVNEDGKVGLPAIRGGSTLVADLCPAGASPR